MLTAEFKREKKKYSSIFDIVRFNLLGATFFSRDLYNNFITNNNTLYCILRLNFSETEIEIFCAKYDKNGDFQFDLEEINAIENGLEAEMDDVPSLNASRRGSFDGLAAEKEEKLAPPNQGMLDT